MRAVLLWLLGIPIPILILLYLFGVLQRPHGDRSALRGRPLVEPGEVAGLVGLARDEHPPTGAVPAERRDQRCG